MDQASKSARGKQIPVSVLHTKGEKLEYSLVCLPLKDFKRMLEVWVTVDKETGLENVDRLLSRQHEQPEMFWDA
jgi:hypothetical protein